MLPGPCTYTSEKRDLVLGCISKGLTALGHLHSNMTLLPGKEA